MKKFIVFAENDPYCEASGLSEIKGSFDTEQEARDFACNTTACGSSGWYWDMFCWAQIVDRDTWLTVADLTPQHTAAQLREAEWRKANPGKEPRRYTGIGSCA